MEKLSQPHAGLAAMKEWLGRAREPKRFYIHPAQVPLCSDSDGKLWPGFEVMQTLPLSLPQPRITIVKSRRTTKEIRAEARAKHSEWLSRTQTEHSAAVDAAFKRLLDGHADRHSGAWIGCDFASGPEQTGYYYPRAD